MMTISLVVATVGRVSDLERLLASLETQVYPHFETIVVDQNDPSLLAPVIRQHDRLNIRILHSDVGASRARNVGLRAATGDIVAIPDDDCWYPPQLLQNVVEWFSAHPDCDALFTSVRTPENLLMVPKLSPKPGLCDKANVWDSTGAVTAFMRRQLVAAVGEFDERLGPGPETPFKACEDIDYFIRSVELGFRMYYDPDFVVHHPDLGSLDRLRRTTYPYALAYGYVMRNHGYSPWYCLGRVARSLAGAMVNLMKVDFRRSRLYLLRAAGQLRGYFWGSRDLARLRAAAN